MSALPMSEHSRRRILGLPAPLPQGRSIETALTFPDLEANRGMHNVFQVPIPGTDNTVPEPSFPSRDNEPTPQERTMQASNNGLKALLIVSVLGAGIFVLVRAF